MKINKKIMLVVILLAIIISLVVNNFKEHDPKESLVLIESSTNIESNGKGFIYKHVKDGYYILTNYHVIAGKKNIKVTLDNKEEFEAERVGLDDYLDLAIIKINTKKKLPLLKFSDSLEGLKAYNYDSGEYVDGEVLESDLYPVTVNDSDDYAMKLIKVSITIKEGFSGTPLLNKNNQVVGIITLKDKENYAYVNEYSSFKNVLDILEKGEAIERPSLGITMTNVYNKNILKEHNISVNAENGVVVVESNNEALKTGDVIIEFNSNKVDSVPILRHYLFKENKGSKVSVKIIRNKEEIVKEITLM